MNKFQSFLVKQKNNVLALSGSVVVSAGALATRFASADLTADIGTIASTVGTTFQSSSVTLLTAVLPYVITISIVFLAARLALRWMRRSAN